VAFKERSQRFHCIHLVLCGRRYVYESGYIAYTRKYIAPVSSIYLSRWYPGLYVTNSVITSGIRVVRNYMDGGSLCSVWLTHGVGIGLGILAIHRVHFLAAFYCGCLFHLSPISGMCVCVSVGMLRFVAECCVSLHR
jgi:hypothetical protein